jgi:hypothetical protein
MPGLEDRISKIEATQHFELAIIAALTKVCMNAPGFQQLMRENLLRHQALLSGESTDEVKLKTFEELMQCVLGSES